jgi:hypothetical protein
MSINDPENSPRNRDLPPGLVVFQEEFKVYPLAGLSECRLAESLTEEVNFVCNYVG